MKRLYVVGIGPGDSDLMTIQAKDVLEQCQVIAGYNVYVDLIKDRFPDKRYITTPMKQEKERCISALCEANNGNTCAMICSGDAGVYGMAGIILELSKDYQEVDIQIVPGVTAALSGGAVLGAPLGHDFSIISLSDLLTPWEIIEKRLSCAAMSDMAICIYNPSSVKRHDYLKKACNLIGKYQPDNLVCGYVTNIGRIGESYRILTLKELSDTKVDMFTTVFIGNSQTYELNNRMVTPRGYKSLGD